MLSAAEGPGLGSGVPKAHHCASHWSFLVQHREEGRDCAKCLYLLQRFGVFFPFLILPEFLSGSAYS